jgi:hypothetical protein
MRRVRGLLFALGVLVVLVVSQGFPFASAQSRMLYGNVYSAGTGKPLTATVTLSRCFNSQTIFTGPDGSWELPYPYGTLGTITFSAPGYVSQSFQINMNVQWYDAGGVVSLQPST